MRHLSQTIKRTINQLVRRISADQGSALVLTGIAMAVLIGFTALAVDGGYMYFRHTKLQDVADASALAAARQLAATAGTTTQKKVAAFNAAQKCVQLNGFTTGAVSGFAFDVSDGDELGHIVISFPAGTSEARVDFNLTASTFFAKAVSIDEAPLGVTAIAEIIRHEGSTETSDLVPIALFHGK